jgi:hypothetical protein
MSVGLMTGEPTMKQENDVSEADLEEHFGSSAYQIVNEREEPLTEEAIMVPEVVEPFTHDRLIKEDESPVDEYLEKVEERFYKQPKIHLNDHY